MLTWKQGRQSTGYKKIKLLELGNRIIGGLDLHILRYDVGDFIPAHTDPVDNKKHYRVNLEVKKAVIGGELFVENPLFRLGRLIVFRSDVSLHSVHEVQLGTRYVLSLGIAF